MRSLILILSLIVLGELSTAALTTQSLRGDSQQGNMHHRPARPFNVRYSFPSTNGTEPCSKSSSAVVSELKSDSHMFYTVVSGGAQVLSLNLSTAGTFLMDVPGWNNSQSWVVANHDADTIMVSSNTPRAIQGFDSWGVKKFRVEDLVFDPPRDYRYDIPSHKIFAEGYNNNNKFFVIDEKTGATSNVTVCPEVRFNSKYVFLHTNPSPLPANGTITAFTIPELTEVWSYTTAIMGTKWQQAIAGVSERYILVQSKRGDATGVDVLDVHTGDLVSHVANVPGSWRYSIVSSPVLGPRFFGSMGHKVALTFEGSAGLVSQTVDLRTGEHLGTEPYLANDRSMTIEGNNVAIINNTLCFNRGVKGCLTLGNNRVPETAYLRLFSDHLVAFFWDAISTSFSLYDTRSAQLVADQVPNTYLPARDPIARTYHTTYGGYTTVYIAYNGTHVNTYDYDLHHHSV